MVDKPMDIWGAKSIKKETVVEPPKVELPQKQEESQRNNPTVLLSETDAYIHDRLKSQPRNLEEVQIKADREQGQDRVLALPQELEKYADKYAFRWIKKHPRSIAYHLDVMNWTLVNRVFFNDVPKHLYTANGTIERGDLILGFIPLKRAEELRKEPVLKSQERVRNTPLQDLSKKWQDRGDSYYKPDSGVSDSGDEAEQRKPGGIVIQPD